MTKDELLALASSARELATQTRNFSRIGRLNGVTDEAAEAAGEADAAVNDKQADFFDALAALVDA